MLILIAAAAVLVSGVVAADRSPIDGHVRRITDGDTVQFQPLGTTMYPVRLAWIDAPEKGQPFGNRARQHLSKLTINRRVTLRPTATDRFKRVVGELITDEGSVNRAMIVAGYAWVFRKYSKDPRLVELEAAARAARRGLWRDPNPTPPWEQRNPKPDPNAPIIGNRRSKIFHESHCRSYAKVSKKNQVIFGSPDEARHAGYRRARNCNDRK